MTPAATRTTGLLLAAGAGRRYGRPKGLVVEGGVPWVVRAAAALLDGGCEELLVVTGAEAAAVEALLVGEGGTGEAGERDARVRTVRCGTWERGMGESLRTGLGALADRGPRGPRRALVHLVDLPDVGAGVVARLLAAAGDGEDALARAAYRGVPGHPVLLGRDHWAGVADGARGDAGARSYLRGARPLLVECGDLATGTDVDTPGGFSPAP